MSDQSKPVTIDNITTETLRIAKSAINKIVNEARFDELTKLGRLYPGSKKAWYDHYESRYNYLKDDLTAHQYGLGE